MEFLESMTIEQLVSLNQDIQKVLKEKRKARNYSEEKFGDNAKIIIDFDENGNDKEYCLKIRQRHPSDCFIIVLEEKNPCAFYRELSILYENIGKSRKYFANRFGQPDN